MPKVALVGSVKGGTGKTLFSINLALELARRGHSVTLIDADISSSYFKRVTGANIKLEPNKDSIKFVEWNGIKVFSMSLLDTGPVSMYGFSERQILEDVYKYGDWRDTEYVIIDLPAGAEDIFKESIRLWAKHLVGIYVVMIPFAAQSARQLIELAAYHEVPVLGLVENMAYVDCRHCGCEDDKCRRIYPFGKPVGEDIAAEYGVKFLGHIPLDPRILGNIERGNPRLPEDLIEPIQRAANEFEMAEPGSFYEHWRKKLRSYVQTEIAKLLATALVTINKSFDIKTLRQRYGFTGGKPFALVITDETGKTLAVMNLKLKEDKIVLVKGKVKPVWVIEIPVRTLVDIVRGYREVNGRKLPFSAKVAWQIGELKAYGPGSTPMALYVLDKLLQNEELVGQFKNKMSTLASLLGG